MSVETKLKLMLPCRKEGVERYKNRYESYSMAFGSNQISTLDLDLCVFTVRSTRDGLNAEKDLP